MNVVARMVTQEQDGIPGYMAHPEAPVPRPGILMVHHAHGVTADYKIDAYRLAQLGYLLASEQVDEHLRWVPSAIYGDCG